MEVQNLPMNGRNFLDLALLVPGVSPTNIGSTQLFAETSAVPGQGISIGSQRNLSNNFIVDGLSANDDAAGLSGIPYGVDAVEQFQVVTSGGQAELGRALGGYINVVTKSGTNTLRGTLYGFFRDDTFNAANALSGQTLPMDQQQFGGSLGGAIAANRTFYFTNFEQRLLDQTGLTTILDQNVPIINARLAATGYPGSPITTGIYPNPVHSANILGKIDHQISGSDQLSVRYAAYHVTSDNSRGAGALNAPTASAGLDNVDHSIAFGNTLTISPRTVNETRAPVHLRRPRGSADRPHRTGRQHHQRRLVRHRLGQSDAAAQQNVPVRGQPLAPGRRARAACRRGRRLQRRHITYPRSARGSYAFSSLANFLTGTLQRLHADLRRSGRLADEYEHRLPRSGRMEARLASDPQSRPSLRSAVPRDRSTRIPTTSRRGLDSRGRRQRSRPRDSRQCRTVLRPRPPPRRSPTRILSAGNTTDLNSLQQPSVSGIIPTQAGAPTFPNILAEQLLTTTLVDFTTMNPNLQNAYSKQASVEIERSGDRRTVSVGYQYLRGHEPDHVGESECATCVAAGTNNGCRPNSTYGNNSQYSSVGESNYHGLHVSFVQRPAAGPPCASPTRCRNR